MSDVLNGISHFLGICVGIVVILLVIGYSLQSYKKNPKPKPKPKPKPSHYHLVYNSNKSNQESSGGNTDSNPVENYETSDPFSNNVSMY